MPRPRFLRFGLLALFAAMLILISVAGWLRSELDLYREEQAILAGLAKAGCTAYPFRGKLDFATTVRRNQEGFAWYEPEWLTRMSDLQVNGDPPQELRRRAAALPTLQSLRVFAFDPQSPPPRPDLRPQAFPPSSELLGRKLPEFSEASIDESRLGAPLPDGETLTGADRDAILAEIRKAWSNPSPQLPPRYIKRIERRDDWSADLQVELLRDGERYWSVQQFLFNDVESGLLTFRNDEAEYGLEYRDSKWRLARRGDKGIDPSWAQRIALQFSKSDLPRTDNNPQLFPRMAILDHVERVARVDEKRVRLDVKPVTLQADPTIVSDLSYDIEKMSLVLREDMDWAVGSERSTIASIYAKTRSLAHPIIYERAFERRQGFVVLTEELAGIPANTAPAGAPSNVADGVFSPSRTQYAWELNPDLDPAIFDPNRYLAEPLLPRTRPFPWWLVTLALGCMIGIYLILRKIVSAFGRRERSAVPVEPAAGA